jgi:signal transduction histidine kinase
VTGYQPYPGAPRRPRLTIRGRLTVVYGGLFLVGGILLLVVTYLLVSRELSPTRALVTTNRPPSSEVGVAGGTPIANGSQQLVDRVADSTLHTLITQGAIALVGIAVLALGLGWVVAGQLLQPLHRVTATARRIADAPAADSRLHERIALAGPDDELKELADTFDLMLARLDESFAGQRRFIANASHELRTPLTLNRALIEVALEPPEVPAEVRQLGTTLLAVNARHTRLVEGLLLLARSEREVPQRAYVDLADIVEHVVAQSGEPGVAVRAETREAPTSGDPVLLERLVQNLVENGVRHNTPDGGWVRVVTGARPGPVGPVGPVGPLGPVGVAWLEVSNTGPVVPPYEVPGLFEPFRRLDGDRVVTAKGAGLGLSIVQSIVRAHDGEVTARPRPEGGLDLTVTLPPAPP